MFLNSGYSNRSALLQKIKTLEHRLKITTDYLTKISNGDYELPIEKQQYRLQNEEENQFQETLSKVKTRLSDLAQRDKERIWIAEGITKFMEIIQGDRSHQDFYNKIINMIVRYTNCIQGGIFLLNDQDPEDIFLELKASYAYNREKFTSKRVRPGDGMLGQCFIEKETSVFTQVPHHYFDVTSALGESRPSFLIIIPLKYDQQIVGIMELASFEPMQKFKIEYVEKIAENLASVALTTLRADKANQLYEQSQLNAKQLLEQEETLRQNIEELQATQEEMKRHQQELNQQTYQMKFIIDNIPFPIFVKDEKGRYTLVNQCEAKLFNLEDTELLGKDDRHFVSNDEEWSVIQQSDEQVLASDQPLELPIQHFTTAGGTSYIFKTTKIPFVNNVTGMKNILGVSIDLTEKIYLEKKLLHEQSINDMNTLINLAGRQRMLSQKIGFYAEMVAKGNTAKVSELKSILNLFEHSLEVIQTGGIPLGILCENPLSEADPLLASYIQSVEMLWCQYKEAATKIIYYQTFKDSDSALIKSKEIEKSLTFIEDHAELLLALNDDLMLACIRLTEDKTVGVEVD